MEGWGWTLLLKPFAAIGVLAGLFVICLLAHALMRVLRRVWPKWLWKDALFDDGGAGSANSSADAGKSGLQNPAIIRGNLGQNDSRLSGVGKDL